MTDAYWRAIRREPSLVAYWRMSDPSGASIMADSGGRYDLFGTYQSADGFSPGSPIIQGDPSALSLSGAVDDIGAQVPAASQLDFSFASSLSLEAWVSYSTADPTGPPATAPLTPLVGKLNIARTIASPYVLYLDGNQGGRPSFAVGNGIAQVVVAAAVATPSHLVGTLYGGLLSLYADGRLIATASQGVQTLGDDGEPVIVGRDYRGLLAEVAVYSGALSARRVARHFALGRQVLADQAHYITVDPPTLA